MKKDAEYISVNTVRATFLLHKLKVFHACYTAILFIFRNTGGRVLILVMTACGNFTLTGFYPHFCVYSFSQVINLRIKPANH